MIGSKKILAIIPARAGSKRLPNKNIITLHGKPLIQWTIEAALGSRCFDSVVVSTDTTDIANTAIHCGATVPFIRPKHLSDSESKSVDVVLHALEELESKGQFFDYVMLLQPTSPMRSSRHIKDAVSLLQAKNAIAVISVCPISHPIEWSGELGSDLSMDHFFKFIPLNKRSQEFPNRYRLNGAIYLISIDSLAESKTFTVNKSSYAYIMKPEESVDIDTQLDLDFCEFLLKRKELFK